MTFAKNKPRDLCCLNKIIFCGLTTNQNNNIIVYIIDYINDRERKDLL